MTVRRMDLDDLDAVLGWAAEEGWNPGVGDAEAFYAADPQGFLIKEVEGQPVAAISVVNHDAHFAFLGLYLCRPAFRGQGHGLEVWRAGIAHAGARSIGLDGVPDQQDNYARSGFVKYGSTVRFEGLIDPSPDPRIHRAVPDQRPLLVARDADLCGMQRTAFAAAWFDHSATRQTLVLMNGAQVTGYATFRQCVSGTKVGPLCAATKDDAHALLAANPFAKPGAPCFVDVQGHDTPLAALLTGLGFEPVFETARMFRGAPPDAQPAPFQAIATMELG